MTKSELREFNRTLKTLAKSGNKDKLRIARTYTTYSNKINDLNRKGYITEKLTISEYVESYQEMEQKYKVLGIKIKSKAEFLAKQSKLFDKAEFRAIKQKAIEDDAFRSKLGFKSSSKLNKMTILGFMKSLQNKKLDRQDLWEACLEACGNDYSAADAMYNSL